MSLQRILISHNVSITLNTKLLKPVKPLATKSVSIIPLLDKISHFSTVYTYRAERSTEFLKIAIATFCLIAAVNGNFYSVNSTCTFVGYILDVTLSLCFT